MNWKGNYYTNKELSSRRIVIYQKPNKDNLHIKELIKQKLTQSYLIKIHFNNKI